MKYKRSIGGIIFDTLNVIFMILFCISIIYPFIRQLTISLSPAEEVIRKSFKLYPKKVTFDAYNRVLRNGQIVSAYYWTIIRIILGTLLHLALTTMMAYPMSKKYLPYRNFWTGLVVFTMFFGGGLVPTYLLIRDLKMLNTIWALVVPGAVSAFDLVIVRNYFMSLPQELEESVKIDGGSDIIVYLRIVLPLSKPILATVTLWSVVGHWNSWFDAMIYIHEPKIKVLQLVLRRVMLESNYNYAGFNTAAIGERQQTMSFTPESIKAAILMVTTIPVLCMYPFLQKYFVKGIMIGSLKG